MILGNPAAEALRTEWREIAATYEALNGAGISLFPVDIRDIRNPGLAGAQAAGSHRDVMEYLVQIQPSENSAYGSGVSRREGESGNAAMAMETAAAETGGEVFRGLSDLSALLNRAQQRWSAYYILSL